MYEISRSQLFRELETALDSVLEKDQEAVAFLRKLDDGLARRLRQRWEKNYEGHTEEKAVLQTAKLLLEYEDELYAQEKRYGPMRTALSKTLNLADLREAEKREGEFLESLLRVLEDYASSPAPVYQAIKKEVVL
jgi:hypothetical protein